MSRTSIAEIRALKGKRKAVMITAYDATSAKLVDNAADIALVGDSVATTVQGRQDTISVTMDQMIYHTRLVSENSAKAFVVGDMPFLSYQSSEVEALRNAGRFLKEGHAQAVKLEGGARMARTVRALTEVGIPVMGHIGYTPQSVMTTGVKVNRSEDALLEDAALLQEAGAFSIVLEMIPAEISAKITDSLDIPTIGIGAGPYCDGQVLVFHDLLGFLPGFTPKFLRRYMNFFEDASEALGRFRDDVLSGDYPQDNESYH
ncbi:MAG: 3-methyl-2-oxobutanoate hydroxymethyltransferase [Planctomycetes bacterium]|nr:3-methyl-2-oxobutanoate hydroxymethyltransferase [Planctomycetota bacterium]